MPNWNVKQKKAGAKQTGALHKIRERAMAHLEAGRHEEALAELQGLLDKNPEAVAGYMGMGRVHFRQGNYEEALKYFQGALHIDRKIAPALNMLGRVYLQLGDQDKALQHFEDALEVDPTLIEPHLSIARICLGQALYGEAEMNAKEALQLNPQLTEARLLLARVHREQGDTAAAIAVLEAEDGGAKDAWRVLETLGRLYLGQGRVDDGIAALSQALAANPDEPRVHLLLGRAYLGLGRTEEAIGSSARALALRPDMTRAKLQLAKAHRANQDPAAARALLVELARGRRALHSVHRLLGDLALDEGQYAQALDEYQASLRHAKELVEKHPELTEIASRHADDQALATAYREAFARIADDEEPDEDA